MGTLVMSGEEGAAVKVLQELKERDFLGKKGENHYLADEVLLDLVAVHYPEAYALYRELQEEFLYE